LNYGAQANKNAPCRTVYGGEVMKRTINYLFQIITSSRCPLLVAVKFYLWGSENTQQNLGVSGKNCSQ
jgi:hypothetical protein